MRITTVYIPTRSGKKKRRYLAQGHIGNVFVSVLGWTRAYAISNAFREIMKPF